MKSWFIIIVIFWLSIIPSSASNGVIIEDSTKFQVLYNVAFEPSKILGFNVEEEFSIFSHSLKSDYTFGFSKTNIISAGYYLRDLINFNPNEVFGSNAFHSGIEVVWHSSHYSIGLISESSLGTLRSISLTIIYQL